MFSRVVGEDCLFSLFVQVIEARVQELGENVGASNEAKLLKSKISYQSLWKASMGRVKNLKLFFSFSDTWGDSCHDSPKSSLWSSLWQRESAHSGGREKTHLVTAWGASSPPSVPLCLPDRTSFLTVSTSWASSHLTVQAWELGLSFLRSVWRER